MAKQLVSDELWAVVEPLLPKESPKPKGGRPRVPDRAALTGILFVLKTGIPWEYLPKEMGCGSGMTCWRRLRAWTTAEVWHRLHTTLLDRLGAADRIDWSRASLDSGSLRAKKGARNRPQSDRSRQGRREGPRPGRPRRGPAGRLADRGQRPRQPALRAADRAGRTDHAPARSSPGPPGQAAR